MEVRGTPRISGTLTLRTTRSLLGSPRRRALAASVAVGYVLVAMIEGGMLLLTTPPTHTAAFLWLVPKGPGGLWNFPAIVAGGPYFLVALPVLSSVVMVLTAVGVGFGMAAAVVLVSRLLRAGPSLTGRSVAGSPALGLTPALIGLLTLGACCSTTAAATAGIALTADASGSSARALLASSWYLALFQSTVVYIALVAQERLLEVTEVLLPDDRADPARDGGLLADRRPPQPRWRTELARALLVAVGITWSLSAFTVFFSPVSSPRVPEIVFSFLVLHQVPAGAAVATGLFPDRVAHWWTDVVPLRGRWFSRALLIGSGASLIGWIPPPWGSNGAAGLVNELLGAAGLSSSWGAAAPPNLGLLALTLRWSLQFGLLGGFALSLGGFPHGVFPVFGPGRIDRTGIGRPEAAAASAASSGDRGAERVGRAT